MEGNPKHLEASESVLNCFWATLLADSWSDGPEGSFWQPLYACSNGAVD